MNKRDCTACQAKASLFHCASFRSVEFMVVDALAAKLNFKLQLYLIMSFLERERGEMTTHESSF